MKKILSPVISVFAMTVLATMMFMGIFKFLEESDPDIFWE